MIAFAEITDSYEEQYLESRFRDSKVLFLKGPAHECLSQLAGAEVLSVFIKSKIDAPVFAAMPKLRFVTTRSTGFDHIDLKAAAAKGIPVSNVPVYGENTVAEHAFALILSLSRNLRKSYLRVMQNDFSIEGLRGFDLKGKTLGVVGTGHIGLHLIRMGIGFGMKVLAFDVKEQKFMAEVMNFEYVTLEELFKRSDILSLHLPYLPSTHHMINQKTIRLIKKGAVLINTARGGLVDTDALVQALDEGILSGAGLDVLEEEEFLFEEKRFAATQPNDQHWQKLQTTLKNHVLLHRENVIYTPHMAFYSREAVERILETTAANIQSFFQGSPQNQVDK